MLFRSRGKFDVFEQTGDRTSFKMVNYYSTSNHIKFVSEWAMKWFRKSETRKE